MSSLALVVNAVQISLSKQTVGLPRRLERVSALPSVNLPEQWRVHRGVLDGIPVSVPVVSEKGWQDVFSTIPFERRPPLPWVVPRRWHMTIDVGEDCMLCSPVLCRRVIGGLKHGLVSAPGWRLVAGRLLHVSVLMMN